MQVPILEGKNKEQKGCTWVYTTVVVQLAIGGRSRITAGFAQQINSKAYLVHEKDPYVSRLVERGLPAIMLTCSAVIFPISMFELCFSLCLI